jgi:hypothetical protein
MLYHEKPPLRNEAPVNLATTSPMPGRSGKVSELLLHCCLIPRISLHLHHMEIAIHSTIPRQHATADNQPATMPPPPRFVSSLYRANPLIACSSVLRRAFGSGRERHSFFWLPRALFCGRAELHYLPLRLLTLFSKLIRSSPYRLIPKVNPHPQKCLPLSPPTSPSLTAAPRSSLAMSTAPSPSPSRLSVT